MKSPTTQRVEVSNLAEVLYLLDRQHEITDVSMKSSWPHGIQELCVTLTGYDIDLDHKNYLLHGGCNLTELPKAFEAVMARVWQKSEGGRS